MGMPSYEISVNLADSDASPSFIVVDTTNDKLVFCDTGGLTADQSAVTDITRPSPAAQIWAPELWLYDASNSPNFYRRVQSYKKPDNTTQRQKVVRVIQSQIDDVISHFLTAYDLTQRDLTGSYDGTSSFNYPLIKIYHSTASAPSQYWGLGSDTAIKQKDVVGHVNPNGVQDTDNYVAFSLNSGATEYFCVTSVIAGDMTAAIIRLSIAATWA